MDDHTRHQAAGEDGLLPQEQDRVAGVFPTQLGGHAVRGQEGGIATGEAAAGVSVNEHFWTLGRGVGKGIWLGKISNYHDAHDWI